MFKNRKLPECSQTASELSLIHIYLDRAAVGVVGGNLPVVDDGIIAERKRMRAAPPAGGIRRVTAVGCPGVAGIVLQAVETADVLGITDSLENAHVLAAGEYVGALKPRVDADDAAHGKFVLVKLAGREPGRQRRDKITPDQRLVGDGGKLARGDTREIDDIEVTFQKLFAVRLDIAVVIKDMQRVIITVLGIDAVGGKAACLLYTSLWRMNEGWQTRSARSCVNKNTVSTLFTTVVTGLTTR